MATFNQLVNTAFFSQGADRAQAESTIIESRAINPESFFISAAALLSDEGTGVNLRQAASTLIKLSTNATIPTDPSNKPLWYHIQATTRQDIKNKLINLLIHPEIIVRKSAAVDIAAVLVVELPMGDWGDLIETLAQVTQNENQIARQSAIQTIGYICERFKEANNAQLKEEQLKQMLMGIVFAMKEDQQDNQMKVIALKALADALPFLDALFDTQGVMEFVSNLLVQCILNQNRDVQIQALQTANDFFKINYMRLGPFVEGFYNTCEKFLQTAEEEVSVPCIEVWNTVCSEYLSRIEKIKENQKRLNAGTMQHVPNHIVVVWQKLIVKLLGNLEKSEDDDEDELESGLMQGSYRCIVSLVSVINQEIIGPMTNYVSMQIQNQNWKLRVAACLSFSSLLEGQIDPQFINNILIQGMHIFVSLLEDPNDKVKESAAKLLSMAAENYAKELLVSANLSNELVIICKCLGMKPSISRHLCWYLCFMSEEIQSYPDSQLNHNVEVVIRALLTNAFRVDLPAKDLSLIDCSFMGIMNLFHKTNNKKISLDFLKLSLQEFKNIANIPMPRRENLSAGLLAAMHSSLLSLQQDFLNTQGWDQLAQDLYNTMIAHFKSKNDVDSDGLYVMAALSTAIKTRFVIFLDDFWQYLSHALSKHQDPELFKTCIGTMADVARACDTAFEKHLKVLDSLFQCLLSAQFNRELKLQIYVCIGDIILACREKCIPFIPNFMNIFDFSFQGCLILLKQSEQDRDYAEQLQDKLVEAYTCMLHGINHQQIVPSIVPHLEQLFTFLQQTTQKDQNPTVDYCRAVLTLIADVANMYEQNAQQYFSRPFVNELIQTLEKYTQDPDNAEIVYYAQKVLKKTQ